jgi:uncharacterized protein YndB with AHSA1/START domain
MPVTSITKDPEALTMTIVADFPVPLARLWDAYADPRQLERFWGPPTWPARFTRHDATPGGLSHYLMTGPAGEVSRSYWEWLAVEPQARIEIAQGFAHEDWSRDAAMPTMRMSFAFSASPAGSRLVTTTRFGDIEAMQTLLGMGMSEGLSGAMGQMDDVLADLRAFAADLPTSAEILSDTQVRISRVVRGSVEAVWRAHHEPDLLRQWLLGPDGWTMPVCEVASGVGDSYRYRWSNGEREFGFDGEQLESAPPHRSVTTERYADGETTFEGTVNELTLTAVEGGTLLTLVITYPGVEMRDAVLATGMTDGMEASYRRLETGLLAPAGTRH